jgi:hypothetical protein
MGFDTRQMRAMSLWEYTAYLDGWRKAHEPEDKQEEDNMTPELFRAIMDAPIGGAIN